MTKQNKQVTKVRKAISIILTRPLSIQGTIKSNILNQSHSHSIWAFFEYKLHEFSHQIKTKLADFFLHCLRIETLKIVLFLQFEESIRHVNQSCAFLTC